MVVCREANFFSPFWASYYDFVCGIRQPRSSTNTGDDEDEDEDNDDDADDKEHDSDASFNTAKSSAKENNDDTGTVDKLIEDLDAFPCLEDIDPIIDLYEK